MRAPRMTWRGPPLQTALRFAGFTGGFALFEDDYTE
jgi:hypothetical protein